MIFIWNRWGILAVPLFVMALVGTQLAVDSWWGHGFYTANYWPKAAAAVVAAALIAGVGWLLNRKEPTWATKHRFFFLPMEWCAALVLFITACITLGHVTGAA